MLPTVGSVGEERDRLARIAGGDSGATFLIRAPSAALDRRGSTARIHVSPLWPELRVVANSRLATGGNDGMLWAGRGVGVLARGGAAIEWRRVRLVVMPEITHATNGPYAVVEGRAPGRSAFSSPWHAGAHSADLPLRMGDQPLSVVGAGQSSLTVRAGAVAFGAATESQWWGPGVRNALVMSNNAEGVPHAFVRTARALHTPLGAVEARWIVGALTESIFFDTTAANDLRSLAGLVATIRPRGTRGLELGAARAVVGPLSGGGALGGRVLDPLRFWRAPDDTTSPRPARRDQVMSVFGRWTPAGGGGELYAEWARQALPRSLRDLLLAPQRSQGYTLGAARVSSVGAALQLALRLELTNLEQTRSYTDRPADRDYYVGRATPQGYTQRGQGIGAAIGPGASAQTLSADVYAPRWQAGAYFARTRWENDALYRERLPNQLRHDVSVGGGLRGGVRLPAWDVRMELGLSNRLNYLFQNGGANVGGVRTVDVRNLQLALDLSPRRPRVAPAARR